MFFDRKKKGTTTPGSQYNRANGGITRRPDDAPQPEPQPKAATPVKEQQPELTPEQKFRQTLMERGLSQISLKYKEMPIIILHEIDPGKEPQRIEKVIERWHNLPGGSRFDVLSFKRHFYCISKDTGSVDMSVELPEKHAQLAQEEQDEKVREFMAELTGEQPAAPAAGVLTAELLNATSMEALVDLAYNMKREDRQRVLDAFHKAVKKRQQEAAARKQSGSGGSGGSDEAQPQPQPAPKPAPQPQRQPATQATGVAATRRRRGG